MSAFNIGNLRSIVASALIIYAAAISVISVIVCCIDKINSKKHKERVAESDLLLLSSLGGAVFMFLTMIVIRHKTRKPKFMIGIPLIIVLHIAVTILIVTAG